MDDDFSADGDLESNLDEQSNADSASIAVVKQEMKMMNIVRTFVFALMITISTITAEVIYIVVRINQEKTFKDKFELYANELIDGFYGKLENTLVAADTLSTSLTLQAHDMQAVWPYVSFSDFEMRTAGTRQMAKASSVTFAPLVVPTTVETWQNYATYVDQNGTLESNHTDEYRPHLGHPHAKDEDSVFYLAENRAVSDGIYTMVKGEAFDLVVPTFSSATSKNGPIFTTTTDAFAIFPLWQRSPTTETDIRMYDQMSNPVRASALSALLSFPKQEQNGNATGVLTDFLIHDTDMTDYAYYSTPRVVLYYPVYDSVDHDNIVAVLDLEFMWETFLEGILDGVPMNEVAPLDVVVQSSCSHKNNTEKEFTFQVTGVDAILLAVGDLTTPPSDISAPAPINSTFEAYQHIFRFSNNTTNGANIPCDFRIRVYATGEFKDVYVTTFPEVCRWAALGIFIAVVSVFLVYDCVVEIRSNRVVESAKRTDALVSTLFPSNVKQRLLEQAEQKKKAAEQRNRLDAWQNKFPEKTATNSGYLSDESCDLRVHMIHTPKTRLKNLLLPGEMDSLMSTGGIDESEPIADLFPNASVMFADISGFTAWSSERDPSQVFKLLETLYRSMDKAARRFRVFKVETIGDCYVAATGLPDQRDDHVEAICRFARTSLLKTNEMTKALEATLGPGTSELAFRFGIHSGPVTAGVLRGEKARFQLFGDTMNSAARMESTGLKNKIHLSQASAEILIKRGKGHWVEARAETVYAKGKGELKTFWLQLGASSVSHSGTSVSSCDSVESSEFSVGDSKEKRMGSRRPIAAPLGVSNGPDAVLVGVIGQAKLNRAIDRLVDWNANALASLLKKVVASRMSDGSQQQIPEQNLMEKRNEGTSRSFMDQMSMVIPLPEYDEEAVARAHEANADIPKRVQAELRMYVAAIASGYRKNPFHNFEHASHVILSATKLLKRISYADGHTKEDGITTEDLYYYTYGISSDPLTQFAVVFAALIHDVGHEGVPNGQLAKELPNISALYENRSIAEQRSVDVALELLMLPKYQNLRGCICGDESGLHRFRQLLIHCVLATDIFEKDLKAQRNQRWEQAFYNQQPASSPISKEDMNRKATIVLEHIIQASDVSHTMQHWHVYIKWNERLYQEMHAAYKSGRAENHPYEGWYKGELWFFDNYVIPLAKKLKECGVFGVSSDEYLTYAMQNRTEWEQRGEELCRGMKLRCEEAEAKAAAKKGKGMESVKEEEEGDDNVYRDEHHRVHKDRADALLEARDEDESHHSYTDH